MSDPLYKDINDCFKSVLEFSNRYSEEMRVIIQSYNELLNHHDLSCAALKQVSDSVASNDEDSQCFNSTEIFKEKLQELQKSCKNTNKCKDLEDLLNDSEEEIQVVCNETGVQIDPFSQLVIKTPGKSTKCNHLFEYKTIMRMFQHLKGNKKTLKCPHIGCAAVLTAEDIKLLPADSDD